VSEPGGGYTLKAIVSFLMSYLYMQLTSQLQHVTL